MKKILYIASLLKKHINVFHVPYIKNLLLKGHIVDIAACNDFPNGIHPDFYDKRFIDINFSRNPFSLNNFFAFFDLIKLLNKNNYDVIHCHTPIPSFLVRIAVIFIKKKPKIIYTAHGFHFYKNGPILFWIFILPIEFFLSTFTDILITLNEEDYKISKYFLAKKKFIINGIGFNPVTPRAIKFKLKNNLKILSVGELSNRKNHILLIRAIKKIKSLTKHSISLTICGEGVLRHKLETFAKKYGIRLSLPGFVNNLPFYFKSSNLFVFPSKQEGLPVSLMQAISTGIPIIASDIRGNTDLVKNTYGIVFKSNSLDDLSNKMMELILNYNFINSQNQINQQLIYKYSISNIETEMKKIYETVDL